MAVTPGVRVNLTGGTTADFPYTAAQVCHFGDILAQPTHHAHRDLALLHEAGITVTFPEPRYFMYVTDHFAHIRDRRDGSRALASFVLDRHPDARCAAQAEADRLNREASA